MRFPGHHRILPGLLVPVLVLASLPFLTGKYVFLLDHVVGPAWDPLLPRLYGLRTAAYGGSIPVHAVLSGVARIGTPAVAQKVLFVGVLSLMSIVGYRSLPGDPLGRTYGALLLVLNPFVYARLIAGQWAVIWGLAMLPLVIVAYTSYIEEGRPRSLAFAVGAITLLGFNAHLLYASGILLASITVARYLERRDATDVRRGLAPVFLALPVNAYWLGPALFSDRGALSRVTLSDLVTYSPRSEVVGPLFSAASMHGFWRGGVVYAVDLFPPVVVIYAVILFLAVYGFLAHRDGPRGYVVRALGVTAIVALPLSVGYVGPTAPVYRWLFETVPFFAGMRDSGKFVALIVVAYAYLGALGASTIIVSLRHRDGSRWVSIAAVVLVLSVPLTYTFPMVTGYAGQVSTGDYPREWYEVNHLIESSPEDSAVLVLPWHRYTAYSWIDGRQRTVATPARQFFSKPVLLGDNVEVGPAYSTSDNALSRYVEFLFGVGPASGRERPVPTNLGELLAHANVEYVVLTKDADWRYYDAILRDQRDLTLVRSGDHVELYRNEVEVDRGYATDDAVAVRDLTEFVGLSRHTDTTDSVYVFDRGLPSSRDGARSRGRERLKVTEQSPVHYRMGASDRRYAVFARLHRAAGDAWRYGGAPPEYLGLGFQPVFESTSSMEVIRYAPFYRIYLPSYAVSVLAALAVVLYAVSSHVDRCIVSGAWERRLARKEHGSSSEGDD